MAERRDRDWYLREWMEKLGKRHVDMVREVRMTPGHASKVLNGVQPYKRDLVLRLADWLEIRPFELLLPPDEALALRRIRENAALIAAEASASLERPAPFKSTPKAAANRR